MAIKINGSTVIDDSQNGTLNGSQSVTGNVTGGNFNTVGVVSSGGNVQAGNLRTAGLISATGTITGANITGANLLTGGLVSATGNVSGNYLLGNAYYVTGLSPTNIYNGTSNVTVVSSGGNVAVGIGGTSNVAVFAAAGEYVTGVVSASGTITGGNLATGGTVSATGTITGGNVATGGTVSATGTITGANITGANLLTGGLVSATGNVTANYILGNITFATGYNSSRIFNGTTEANIGSSGGNANISVGGVSNVAVFTTTGEYVTGAVSASGNVYANSKLFVGANTTSLTNPVAVFTGAGAAYDQLALYNSTGTGSADIAVYANAGDDTQNWADLGFTGTAFNDTNYTITGPGDGYFFVQGNTSYGGNLVVATGNTGTTRDIVFSFGWLAANEFLRFKRSNNTILPYANTTVNLGGTSNYFNNVYAVNHYGTTATTTGNIVGGNLSTAGTAVIGGLTLSGNTIVSSGSTLTLDPNGTGGVDGQVTIAGNLRVTGNVTYVDSNVVVINDKIINIANNAATASDANGAGITVGPLGSEYASIYYNSTSNTWVITNGANVSGTLSASGAAIVGSLSTTGAVTAASTVGGVITGSSASVTGAVTSASVVGGVITGTSVSTSGAVTAGSLTTSGALGAASASVTGNILTGNLSVQGNINLTGNTNSITGNAAVFTGNSIGSGALYAGVSGGNVALQYPVFAMTSSANAYTQMGGQNINTGTQASYDYVITADGGTDTTDFIDLGMAGSAWNGTQTNSPGTAVGARDGYLYVQGGSGGGNLVIGTSTASRSVKFMLGGVNSANVFTTIANTGISTNSVSSSGNVTGGNILTGGSISATGNITGGNILGGANVNATTHTGTSVSVSGGVTAASVAGGVITGTSASVSGGVTAASVAGGVITGTSASVSGGVTAASVAGGVITGTSASVSGTVTGASLAGTITTASQTNITAVGTLTSLNSGAISSSGNVTGANFLTAGLISATGNITGGNILGGANVNATTHTGTSVSVSGGVTAASVSGGVITGTSASVSGTVTGATIAGTSHTGTTVSMSGTITGASLAGTITTASQTNITAVGTLTSLNSGTISSSGTVTGTTLIGSVLTGTLSTASQTNITAVGTLTSLNSGTISSSGTVTGTTHVSTVATGTAPLTVTSTTKVTNLNVDYIDGYHADVAGTASTVLIRDASSYANVAGLINAGANGVGNIGSSTTYFNTVFAKATSAQYADLAEKYVADQAYEPGTVVSFGGSAEVTLSTVDSDRRIAGVVSTNPSYIMNSGLDGSTVVTVALTGRVPVSVTGAIAKGDMIVSAGNGVARSEANPAMGTVIGKALEDFNGEAGVIEVVVGRL